MTWLRALTFIFLLLSSTLSYSQENTDKLFLLPLLGYSSDQGFSLGAQTAWLGIDGSPWDISSAFAVSTLYQQTFLNLVFTNRKFFDIFYFQGGGFFNQSSRSLFYGLGNNSAFGNESQYSFNDTAEFVRVGIHIPFIDPDDALVFGIGINHRSTGLDRGSDTTLPQMFDLFSNSPRLSGTTTTSSLLFFAV